MSVSGVYKVLRAGVNSTWGGGAVFVQLEPSATPGSVPQWFQVGVAFESQILATALAAITANKLVDANVGTSPDTTAPVTGLYYVNTLHLVA